jgi:hypothetical protein
MNVLFYIKVRGMRPRDHNLISWVICVNVTDGSG